MCLQNRQERDNHENVTGLHTVCLYYKHPEKPKEHLNCYSKTATKHKIQKTQASQTAVWSNIFFT